VHRNENYDGQHMPIIDQALWDQVQSRLIANRSGRERVQARSGQSLLAGLLYDDWGNPMSPSHTKKSNGRRYRYYVSQALLQNDRARAGTVSRIPAEAIEQLWSVSGGETSKPAEISLSPRGFVERVILYKYKVEIVMSEEGLKKLAPHDSPATSATRPRHPKKFSVSVRLARRGRSGRLESSDGKVDDRVGRPDAAVVKAISRAYDWLGRFERAKSPRTMSWLGPRA